MEGPRKAHEILWDCLKLCSNMWPVSGHSQTFKVLNIFLIFSFMYCSCESWGKMVINCQSKGNGQLALPIIWLLSAPRGGKSLHFPTHHPLNDSLPSLLVTFGHIGKKRGGDMKINLKSLMGKDTPAPSGISSESPSLQGSLSFSFHLSFCSIL